MSRQCILIQSKLVMVLVQWTLWNSCILGFHPRDFCLTAMLVSKQTCSIERSQWEGKHESVLCIVLCCRITSDWDKPIGLYRIPSLVSNKENLRKNWLQSGEKNKKVKEISRGDTESKDVVNFGWIFGKHFDSGKPAPYHVDWVPTLQLAQKIIALN